MLELNKPDIAPVFPAGGGDVGALMRVHDWSTSLLGPPHAWPAALRTTSNLVLNSRFPMFMAWGEELIFIYNDAYAEILGNKHPQALGRRFHEVWAEIWSDIFPIVQSALAGQSRYFDNLPLAIVRDHHPELAYFTFSYSPLHDEHGTVAGLFCTVIETTETVLNDKLRSVQNKLLDAVKSAFSAQAVISSATQLLAEHLQASRCWFAEIDDQNKIFHMQGGWFKEGSPVLPASGNIDDFGPALVETLRAGTEFVADDLVADVRTAAYAGGYAMLEIRSIVIVPLIKDGRLLATLNLTKPVTYHWTFEDIFLIKQVTELTWSARENALAQATLKHERDRSRYIFDTMTEGYALLGSDGTIQYVNEAASRVTLQPPDTLIGRNHWDKFPELAGTEVQALFQRVQATKNPEPIDYFYTFPSGQTAWIGFRVYPSPDGGLAVFFSDITRRKEAETALSASEAKYRELFNNMVEEVHFWELIRDERNRIVTWRLKDANPPALKTWGRVLEDILGKTPDEIFGTGATAHYLPVVEKVMDEGVPYAYEDYLPNLDRHFRFTTVPLGDHFITTGADITVIKKTIHDNEQLLAQLREANGRKDEFLAMLAHELRNPLAPISAAAELLQMVKLDEDRLLQTSEIIVRQVNHMTGLVNDLLDVSRVTRGLVKLEMQPLDIRNIVTEAVEQVNPLIQSRRHHLRLDQTPDTTMVAGDKKRLVQVVANLVNNAAKYTPEGGNILVMTEVRERHVLLQVIDDGIGIEPEFAARIFELFAQAEVTSDRTSGGLGLGLALVKSLIELHGGTVTCESKGKGRGSKFTVCLPRVSQPAKHIGQHHLEQALQNKARSLRILVVDDNVDAAVILTMLLEAAGHTVYVEHGSRRALARARIEKPDVCLLDIGLPEMDGNELAHHLRSQPETANSVLIAITGYGQEDDRKNALAAGFSHHLVKPVDTSKLAAILAEIESD